MTNINNSTAVENVTNNRKSTVTNVEFYDSVLQLANEGFRPVYWNNDGELFGVVYRDEDHIMCSLDGTYDSRRPFLTAISPNLEHSITSCDAENFVNEVHNGEDFSISGFAIDQLPLLSYKESMEIISSCWQNLDDCSVLDAVYEQKEAEVKQTRFEQLPENVREVFANSSSKTFVK